MAKSGGNDGWKVALLFAGAFVGLAILTGGRGEQNSPLVPDILEDQIDRAVAGLNRIFGRQWVNNRLDYLQAQLELAMPGVAALVSVLHWAEQQFGPRAGAAKKQAAIRLLRG
jgi:hypothetical protein